MAERGRRVAAAGHVFMTWKRTHKMKAEQMQRERERKRKKQRERERRRNGGGKKEAKRKQITKCSDHFYFTVHAPIPPRFALVPTLPLPCSLSSSLSLLALGFYGRQRRVSLELRVQRAMPQRAANKAAEKINIKKMKMIVGG